MSNITIIRRDFTCHCCGKRESFFEKTYYPDDFTIKYAIKKFEKNGWMFTDKDDESPQGVCAECCGNQVDHSELFTYCGDHWSPKR